MLRSDGIFILILFPDEMNAMSRWYLISICQRFNYFVSANKMFVKLNVFSNYKKISLSVNSIIHVCCGKKNVRLLSNIYALPYIKFPRSLSPFTCQHFLWSMTRTTFVSLCIRASHKIGTLAIYTCIRFRTRMNGKMIKK